AEPHVLTLTVHTPKGRPNEVEGRTSRTVALAPRASTIVTVPRLQSSGLNAGEVDVVIDGDEQAKPLQLAKTDTYASYNDDPDVVVGRNVPSSVLTMSWGISVHWVRAEIAPDEWSTSWMQYGRFEGALLTPADWNELPPAVQTALLRWVSAGGSITFFGTSDAFAGVGAEAIPGGTIVRRGFGQIAMIDQQPLSAEMFTAIKLSWERPAPAQVAAVATEMPILDKKPLPLGALFSVLIAFAVVSGPVSLYKLAKNNRRLAIFWLMPLLAMITTVVLVGATFASEGFVRMQRTRSVTLLDETRGEAVTHGWTGFYTTVRPDGKVRFDSSTEARPMHSLSRADADWTDGQRLLGGWVNSRFPSYFAVRKAEARRERLPIRRESGRVTVVNGLGADITKLWVAGDDNVIYVAEKIARGQGAELKAKAAVDPTAKDVRDLYYSSQGWSRFANHVENDPRAVLRPGMYVAVVQHSPFLETALEGAKSARSDAVVIGWSHAR
ncbi:MAG TPA: hypothetical protein VMU84_11355, partial [Thermoanaerobaculia bacterium]|nr:hypothetical protein [Thermoanaerobaculia bacterium]